MNMLKAPNRIFLQWDQEEEEDFHPDPGEITWSEDRVYKDDLEYVLPPKEGAE